MRTVDASAGIEWLDRDECLRLLAADEVGRLAVVGAPPAIFPVVCLDGEAIVFRTDPGTELNHGSRARVALGLGEVVVLDASWADRTWREEARSLAGACHADLVELRCVAPTAVAAERMRGRAATGGDPSDATPEIAVAMAADEALWPTATTIGTGGDPPEALKAALVRVDGPGSALPEGR